MSRIRLYITILFAYTTLAGLVTFSLFICEEASQTTMFGTWPAKDAKQWDLVLTGANLMEKINTTEKIICYSVGWIQPLAFFSYRLHTKSADYYVKSLRAEVFAYAPELLVGEKVEFYFKPRKIETKTDGKRYAVSGKVIVEIDLNAKLDTMKVSGYVSKKDNQIIILREKL